MERLSGWQKDLAMDPSIAGFLAGCIHHSLIQYPNQAKLFTTVYAIAIINAAFVILTTSSTEGIQFLLLLQNLAIFNVVYASTALVLKTVYNIYFRHRGIPTTFWFAASDWTYWKVQQFDVPFRIVADLHRELGPIVRIQPNHITFNDVRAIEDIYGYNTKAQKGEIYANIAATSKYPASLVTEVNNTRHGFLRRVMSPSFGPTSLKSLEPTMNRYYNEFLEGIGKRASQNDGIVEMNEWFHNLSFDITGALALGTDFNSLRSGEPHFFINAIHGTFYFLSVFAAVPWLLPVLRLLPTPKWVKNARERCQNFSRDAVLKCLEDDTSLEHKNLLTSLRTATDKETGKKLTVGELVINANAILIAGADTSAVSLTFALYHVISIPKVWNRISKEIRDKFDTLEDINGQTTASLAYLDAVINENLRIHPVAANGPTRVTPPEGMTIAGHFIKGNTTVSCPNWTIFHNERYFSNPHSFIPERWIDAERGNETCVKKACIPFSYGKRDCIGKALAMMEMRVTLAKLIWQYDIRVKTEGQAEPAFFHRQVAAGKLEVRISRVERS